MPSPPRNQLPPGLHLVSTPIGAAEDITLKALRVLQEAEVLAAEDTRTLRRLMDIHGIALKGRRIIAYHDHNGDKVRPGLLQAIRDGQSVAYTSDAGTPLISDPGFDLARAVVDAGLPITAAPGASAVLTALTLSGLPSDKFFFAGFPPSKQGPRRTMLQDVAHIPATLILYESPKRLNATLDILADVTSDKRQIAICRELTKRFEEILRGTLDELRTQLQDTPVLKGEIVLVLGPPPPETIAQDNIDDALRSLLLTSSVKDSAAEVAKKFNLSRRDVYARAQELKDIM